MHRPLTDTDAILSSLRFEMAWLLQQPAEDLVDRAEEIYSILNALRLVAGRLVRVPA